MGITITSQQLDDLLVKTDGRDSRQEPLETIYTLPSQIGSGVLRELQLCEGLLLSIVQAKTHDLTIKLPENSHLVQFMVHLSGVVDSGDFLYQDRNHSYIGGSGIQRQLTSFHPTMPVVSVNIHFRPQLFQQFFALPNGDLPAELQPLVKDNDWQQVFSTKTTTKMRSIVKEIVNCPLSGAVKRLYLQGKVFELVALQLAGILPREDRSPKSSANSQIYHAAEILRSQLEQPPCQTTLAQLVGVSDRTLRRGFQEVFGTTILNYSMQHRMHRAKQLLSDDCMTVAEVANLVGCSHLGRFAAAFRSQFGMTPHKFIAAKSRVRAKF